MVIWRTRNFKYRLTTAVQLSCKTLYKMYFNYGLSCNIRKRPPV